MIESLKISSKSKPNSIAGALTALIKETDSVEMQMVGAGALNQAMKAVAIARGFIAPIGIDLSVIPSFVIIKIGDEERTGIKLLVRKEEK